MYSIEQIELIHKTFGSTRFVYNYFLNLYKQNGYIKAYDMCQKLKDLYLGYPWLKECDSCSLRCAIFNLEKKFFAKQSYRTNCIKSNHKGIEYSNIENKSKRKNKKTTQT